MSQSLSVSDDSELSDSSDVEEFELDEARKPCFWRSADSLLFAENAAVEELQEIQRLFITIFDRYRKLGKRRR